MTWIRVRIQIVPIADNKDNKKVSPDDAYKFIDQIKNDALYGTYAELDQEYWASRMDRSPDTLSEVEMKGEPESTKDELNRYEFELRLSSELFPPQMGGAQHLFGILAGDLLRFTLPPIRLKEWEIKDIEFPTDWSASHFDSFRKDIANDIRSIRSAFNLTAGMPLLAFSFKPRVGFSLDGLRQISIEVLSAGFNIVELDTRNIPLDSKMLDKLINLACDLPGEIKRHVGRLSLNLSLPSDLALEAAERIARDCPKPAVIKIDGGFNGLSSVQSIRRRRIQDGRKLGPIITCYPLLQTTLSRFIPGDQYIQTLAASGIDILYPGRRPDVGMMVRSLEGSGENNQVGAVRRYIDLSRNGWPMLSVAGGIYPGQLQAFYELLGPDVAWFLGGGVALHKDGPGAGAKMCVQIAKEAAERGQKANRDWAQDLSESLVESCDDMFRGRSAIPREQLRYVSPSTHLSKVNGLHPYRR
jgi:ribulose 1,5-bisphosphate carboxylase large subunit-like protein